MKKIKRAVAAMTAGLLCLAGTPTLPSEIQQSILLNANATDDVAADPNAWYLRDGLNVSVVLAPGEQKQLTFKCRRLNENNYYSYSEIGYNEISQYAQISSDYDENLIQVDEETGYITAVEGTDGGTTTFTVEDALGNTQEVNVRVVGRDLEIVGMHVQSDNSYYFLDGSDTQDIDVYLGWNYGELKISYDYYTGYPDYEFVKDTYSPDLCEEVTYDDYYISFDKETGVFRVYGGESEIVITGSNGFEQKLNVWGYVDATTTRASTTTTTSTITETTTTSTTEAEELSDFEVVIDQRRFTMDELFWNDYEVPVYVRLSDNHPALSEFEFGFVVDSSCDFRIITDSEEARYLGGESLDFQVDYETDYYDGENIAWVTWSGDEEESLGTELCLIMIKLPSYVLPGEVFDIRYRSIGVNTNSSTLASSHTWKNKNGTDYAEKDLVYGVDGRIWSEGEVMATTSAYVPETVTTETIRTETYPAETYATTTAMTYTTSEATMTTTSAYVPMESGETTTTTTYYGETTTAMAYTTPETTRMTTTLAYVPETTTYDEPPMSTTSYYVPETYVTTTSAYMPMESNGTTTTYYGETTTFTTSYTTTSTTSYTTTSYTTTSYTTTSYTTTSYTTTSYTTTSMVITTETTSLATETTTEEPIAETTTQATTEEPVETTVTETTEEPVETTTAMETTEEPVATTEITPEATEEPTEDLPETGTTGTLPARVAECSALAMIIGGTVMILKSRKREN